MDGLGLRLRRRTLRVRLTPGGLARLKTPALPAPALAALIVLALSPGTLAAQEASPAGGVTDRERPASPRWWVGFQYGLASPTGDLGKINDSGPLFVGTVGRKLGHPFSVRATAAFIPLLEGGLPKSGFPGPFGPETDLLILTLGPSIDLTPEGLDAVDVSGTACGGVTYWESRGSEITEPFTDADFTACVFMDAIMNLSRHWAVNAHFDGFMIAGSSRDDNPFRKEFVHGYAFGFRVRF